MNGDRGGSRKEVEVGDDAKTYPGGSDPGEGEEIQEQSPSVDRDEGASLT